VTPGRAATARRCLPLASTGFTPSCAPRSGQAVKWGWIRRNPADHAEPGEILEEEVEPPADVDVVHLLAEAEDVDHRLALFLQLAIVTGARRSALCALRWLAPVLARVLWRPGGAITESFAGECRRGWSSQAVHDADDGQEA
jgi:hypothetical protein